MSHTAQGPDCLDEDRVTAFLARTLTVEQRDAVELHIDVCDDCRALLAELAQSLAPCEPTIEQTAMQAAPRGSSLARGATIGRFVILDVLGVGGMGVVYAAYDPELDRKVAVKLLHPTQAPQDAAAGGRARLLLEAQAMARLHHEHVITVYEVDTLGEDVFLAMELVEGANVRQWLLGERPGWRAIVEVFVRAGRGLAAAHASGIVHRDFKPDNVLIGRDGRVKVTDFGLAASGPTASAEPAAGGAAWLVTGTVAGTPAYMAPEQFAGRIVDARSDQFSFCVALYEALCGARPFTGDSSAALAEAVGAGRISPAPGERGVPGWLRRLVARGLAVAPEQRHASMEALLAGLERGLRRRRQRLMGAGAVGLAVVAAWLGGLGLAAAPVPEPLCTGDDARLAEVWGQDQRDAVHAAFLATGKPYAGDVWLGVDRALAEYTAGWNQAHVRACEATHVRKEESPQLLDLRMMCLDDRLAELAALVAIFREADAAVVERGVQAARSLSSFRACEGRASGLANLAPPADAEVARQVAELRRALATARAAHDAGRYAAARAEAERVRDQAATIGFRPLLGEALLALGRAQEGAGAAAEARTSYEEAALVAEAGRDDDTRARALIRQVETVGVALAEREQAATVARTAAAVVERIGDDRELRGLLHLAVGYVRRFEARYDEALAEFESAQADLNATRGDDDPIHADLLMAMGGARGGQTRHEEALEMYGRALEQRKRLLGPAHPDVGKTLANIAVVRSWQGDSADALALDHQALAVLEASLGPTHPMVATVLNNVVHLHMIRGEVDDALSTGRRVVALREQIMAPDHPEVAQALYNLANSLLLADSYDEALRLHERALAIRIAKLGPEHPRTGWSHASVGICHMVRGELDEAERATRKALAIEIVATGAESMDVYSINYLLGDVLVAQKRWRDAAAAYGRGLELAPALLKPDHPDLAYPLTGLGRCHLELGRPGEALELLERALTIRRSFKGIPAELADTLFPLARARVAAGRSRTEALALAGEAAALYGRSTGGINVANREEVERWMAALR